MRESRPRPKLKPVETRTQLNPYLKLAVLLGLILLILTLMWIWGLKVLANLDSFWNFFNPNREVNIGQSGAVFLPPPQLAELPRATKEKSINVRGFAPEGSLVKLFENDKETASVRSDRDGNFTFYDVTLERTENRFAAKIDGGHGRESQPSETQTVKYLIKGPNLSVSEPADKAQIQQKESVAKIRGKTDPAALVTVNGQKTLVTANGDFTYLFPLNDGENKIVLEATDEAGNKTTVEKTVTFSRTF